MYKPMPLSLGFIATCGLILVACLASNVFSETTISESDKKNVQVITKEELPVTMLPTAAFVDPAPQSKMDYQLVDRLASGIFNIHTTKAGYLIWYECGKKYDRSKALKAADNWAHAIITACKKHFSKDIKTKVWGVAGTIYNESNFDRCALGKYPRRFAERLGYLRHTKKTLSRPRPDIERYFNSGIWRSRFHRTGMDVGPLQVLTRFTSDTPISQLMTLHPGLYVQVEHMSEREHRCPGNPWACWPGKYSTRYDRAIKKKALRLGAKVAELW